MAGGVCTPMTGNPIPGRFLVPIALLALSLFSCSSGSPPDDLFHDDVEKMVLVDRALGFDVEISGVEVVKRRDLDNRVEVEVRVTGWATHPDLTIGATLPAGKERQESWATWKYFCRKNDKVWEVEEKYKVDEGFK